MKKSDLKAGMVLKSMYSAVLSEELAPDVYIKYVGDRFIIWERKGCERSTLIDDIEVTLSHYL